ncbi:MAG: hypothetical protein C0392_15460 [Syntrophus sp. (in: bacteria)]|nr:hypothetical protein [Syntrophus sp. (in: bacteria)]
MKTRGVTAEIFLTAFKTLPKKEQDAFFVQMLKDVRLREDLIDIAIAEGRSRDKTRPFRGFLKEHGE